MKIVGIIQARMGSTRLPGKIMKRVNGKSLLEYQIERIKQATLIDELVIATTTKESDECIVDFCHKQGLKYFRGSEKNVLERYYLSAKESNADVIVRMTSDCPLIDPVIIDKVISHFLNSDFDYVSNTQIRSYPRGMDTEVFTYSSLEQAYLKAKKDYEKEHVTPYIYLNPNVYKIGHVVNKIDYSKYRITVDTPEDLKLISILIETLYEERKIYHLDDILKEFEKNSHLFEINKHVEQKKLGDT